MENEAIIALDIRLQLVELGFEPVGHETQGEQAIFQAGHLRPDLVLMDIDLPGMEHIKESRATTPGTELAVADDGAVMRRRGAGLS